MRVRCKNSLAKHNSPGSGAFSLSKEETMFHSPGYSSVFFEQYILLNWRIDGLDPPEHKQSDEALHEKLPNALPATRKGDKKIRKVSRTRFTRDLCNKSQVGVIVVSESVCVCACWYIFVNEIICVSLLRLLCVCMSRVYVCMYRYVCLFVPCVYVSVLPCYVARCSYVRQCTGKLNTYRRIC